MGAVGVDIHKHEYQYRQINFSDVDCIKGLIKNRYMIDPYYGNETNNNIYEAGEVIPINQELIGIFRDLDELIKETKLTSKQIEIVNMLFEGNNEEDVATHYYQRTEKVDNIINTICEKIKKSNDYKWKYDYIYLNYIKSNWEFKECGRCKRNKPKSEEFFNPDSRNKDGLHSFCRSCR